MVLTFILCFTGDFQHVKAATSKNAQLSNMGFSKDEINGMQDQTKNKLLNAGGKRADYEVTETEYYNSLDGTKYEVTDENRDEINKIMQKDIEEYSKKSGISIMYLGQPIEQSRVSTLSSSGGDQTSTDKLSFTAYLDQVPSGNPSTEVEYLATIDFSWMQSPSIAQKDHMALAWDERFIGVANSLDGYYLLDAFGDGNFGQGSINLEQSLYGFDASFTLGHFLELGGASQNVRVAKQYSNRTAKFEAKYIHTFLPLTGGVNIGQAFVNVPSDWLCQEFKLDFNLIIGS